MKKTIFYLSLLLLSGSTLSAQNAFTGTIEYAYNISGEGSEMMASMMPEKMIVKYGAKNMMTYMEGGMMGAMMGKIIVDNETGESFIRKDEEEAIYLISQEEIEEQQAKQEKPKVEKLEDKKEILGYSCQKYKVTTMQEGKEMVQYIWTTDGLKLPEIKKSGANQMGGLLSSEGVPGFPLEVVVTIPQTSMTLNLVAEKAEKGTIEASEFARPANYKVKDISEMMGGKQW